MSDTLRFEWVRLRTLRSTYWLVASALVLNAAIAFLLARATRNDPVATEIVGAIASGGGANPPLPLAAAFLAAIGIFATGHEYRYGTIQPTLTAIPQRSTVLAAKVVVVATVAAGFAAVSVVVNLVTGMAVWGEVPDLTAPPLGEVVPGYLVVVVLWAVLGAALGQLFRGVATPLIVIVVVPLVVEQLVFRLSFVPTLDWLQPVVKFLPFLAGQRLVNLSGEAAGTNVAGSGYALFDRWASGAVFAGFVAIVLATAWILFQRRDA